MDEMWFWAAAIFAALVVGMGKGGLPVVAMLSVPVLSLVMDPMLGAALILPVYIISDIYGIWLYRHAYAARIIAIFVPASLIGIAAGWLFAERTDPDFVRAMIGLIGLGFLAQRFYARSFGGAEARGADVPRGVFWGAIAGFTSFVSHAGGPPYQVYVLPQRLAKMTFAGTSTITFACINLMKLPPYIALDLLNLGDMRAVLLLAPVAVFGAWSGHRLTQILPERLFFGFVYAALLLISLELIFAAFR